MTTLRREEQRFGVLHKERLKALRSMVDVVTMTATPIPRTLYLSLTGLRDLSTINTPPHDRLPVETRIVPFDEELIRRAILHELNRSGQVFFLHNRVRTIDTIAQRVRGLVPEARVEIGHGQMPERRLEQVMLRFVRGEVDVLVCTTIIESGIDIPNANTIIIDRADRFGLAELYQLRGRVGRYRHQAYAYLLLPPGGSVRAVAGERLHAIRRFCGLGSGFRLAMRDLELRGAGNLLGREQHGHIMNVGFDLYCQLLRDAVAHRRGERPRRLPPVQIRLDFLIFGVAPDPEVAGAYLPVSYVAEDALRVEAYRRLGSSVEPGEVEQLAAEWTDRFGAVPRPAQLLLAYTRLRIAAAKAGIDSIEVKDGKLMPQRCGLWLKSGDRFPRVPPGDALDRLRWIEAHVETLRAQERGTGASTGAGQVREQGVRE